MRSFVAIELPDRVRESLAALRERLRKSGAAASWVREENMHLTLRFLGDVAQPDLDRLSEVLGERLPAFSPLMLRIQNLGAFPNPRRPSVVWVGVEMVTGSLMDVQESIEAAARAIGVPPDDKPFHPHITLARIRDTRRLGALFEEMAAAKEACAGEFTASRVALFSSTLTPRGPVYRRLREYSLECSS